MRSYSISLAFVLFASACGSDDSTPLAPDAAAEDAAAVDGAPAPDGFSTGVVECEERPCVVGDEVCCHDPMTPVDTCVAPGACAAGGDVRVCDGPEDCEAGELCCMMVAGFSTSCVPDGTCSQIELCHDVSTCSGAAFACCPVLDLMACSYMGGCL